MMVMSGDGDDDSLDRYFSANPGELAQTEPAWKV